MAATTEKIKIKVNVAPRYKEVEISFPYYVKDGCTVIKFFDRRKGIMVADYDFSKHIQYMSMPENWLAYEPTTEEEFNEKFNEVMTALITFNNEKTI
jgi:hypothetical protein